MGAAIGIDVFTARRAAAIAGISSELLDLWITKRLMQPSVLGAKGRGSRRVFSFRDVVALRVAVQLREHGIPPAVVSLVVAHIQSRGGLSATKPLAPVYLALRGTKVFEIGNAVALDSLREPSPLPLTLIPLDEVVSEVQRSARRLQLEEPTSHLSENSLVKRAAARTQPAA